MKKISILILSLVLLTSCSSNKTIKLSDEKETNTPMLEKQQSEYKKLLDENKKLKSDLGELKNQLKEIENFYGTNE